MENLELRMVLLKIYGIIYVVPKFQLYHFEIENMGACPKAKKTILAELIH